MNNAFELSIMCFVLAAVLVVGILLEIEAQINNHRWTLAWYERLWNLGKKLFGRYPRYGRMASRSVWFRKD